VDRRASWDSLICTIAAIACLCMALFGFWWAGQPAWLP